MICRIIQQINHLVDFCREFNIPIIWIRHNVTISDTLNNSGLFALFHDEKSMSTITNLDKGTEIYAAMHFDSTQDHIVFKNRYSAFLSDPPELHTLLKKLNKRYRNCCECLRRVNTQGRNATWLWSDTCFWCYNSD